MPKRYIDRVQSSNSFVHKSRLIDGMPKKNLKIKKNQKKKKNTDIKSKHNKKINSKKKNITKKNVKKPELKRKTKQNNKKIINNNKKKKSFSAKKRQLKSNKKVTKKTKKFDSLHIETINKVDNLIKKMETRKQKNAKKQSFFKNILNWGQPVQAELEFPEFLSTPPFPEYTMTLSDVFKDVFPQAMIGEPLDGNIFMNSFMDLSLKGHGKRKSYIVQFWWGEGGDGYFYEYFIEIRGGEENQDKKTKILTVVFTGEECNIWIDDVPQLPVTVTFTLIRDPHHPANK